MTRERKLISERRNPSCAERNAALKKQISPATNTKQGEMYDGLVIVSESACPSEREVRADSQGKGRSHQARFPAAVPGADHDSDGKDHQAALHDVGKQQGRNEGKNNAENGDAVSEDGGPSRRNVAFAKKGELRSHKKNLIPATGLPRVTGVQGKRGQSPTVERIMASGQPCRGFRRPVFPVNRRIWRSPSIAEA